MKKFFLILGGILAVILLAMILIPYFYKDNLLDTMKTEANKNLKAEVDFSNDIGLSLFRNFPHATLTVKDIQVVNKAPFQGDTLAQLDQFQTTIDLFSLISGDQMEIRGLHLDKPRIHVKVLTDGTANYNIMKSDTTASESPEESSSEGGGTFKMALNNYSINNAHVVYDDQAMGLYTKLKGFQHKGSGDFTMEVFNLDTDTEIQALTLAYGGVNYMNRVETLLDAKLKMNLNKMKFTFLDNKLSLNDLNLGFDGFVAMPGDDINMDVSLNAPEAGFKNLVSLVPAVYKKGYEDIETEGSLTLKGKVNGTYNEDQYPAYDFQLAVNDGYFQYPDLPKSLNNVNLDLAIDCPDGVLDNTVTNLKQLHFEVGSNPFDAQMLLKTPMSDPYVDAGMNGTVNLGHFSDIIPLDEKTQLKGILESDLAVKGNYSSIEKEAYGEFDAKGNISLTNFLYDAPSLNQAVNIEESRLTLTPQKANLEKFALKMGDNDLYAQGKVNNMLGYMMKGKTLSGNLQVNSNYFNLNPMLASEEGTEADQEASPTAKDTGTYTYEAPAIPGNIDFTLEAELMKRLIYDNMDMRNLSGKIIIRDKAIRIRDFNMEMFEGSMMASGQYNTQQPERPLTDFDLQLKQIGIQNAYKTFTSLQKYAPIAAKAEGTFDANVSFSTPLKKDLMPIYDKLYSKGKLTIDRAVISEHKILSKVADVLQDDAYQKVVLTDVRPSYIIEDGRIRLTKPINFNVEDAKFELTGSMKLDQTLDYNLQADVPAKLIKQKAGQLVSTLAGQNVDIPGGDRLLVDFKITGPASDPNISPSFGGTKGKSGGAKEALEQKAKKELKKRKQQAKQKAKEEAQKAKEKAKQKAQQKKKQAQEEAQKKKEKAEEKAKEKAKEKKQEAEEEAEDKVKDIFD